MRLAWAEARPAGISWHMLEGKSCPIPNFTRLENRHPPLRLSTYPCLLYGWISSFALHSPPKNRRRLSDRSRCRARCQAPDAKGPAVSVQVRLRLEVRSHHLQALSTSDRPAACSWGLLQYNHYCVCEAMTMTKTSTCLFLTTEIPAFGLGPLALVHLGASLRITRSCGLTSAFWEGHVLQYLRTSVGTSIYLC